MKKGFSLIELLLSLIVVSLILSAFAPIITKKIKHREIAISASKVGTDCSKFSEKCLICSDSGCMLCTDSCPLGQYYDANDNCACKNCSALFSNCTKCTKNYCEACNSGYKPVNGICQKITCSSGYYLSGSNCLPCISPCSSCSSSTYCTGCTPGYKLNGGKCEQETEPEDNSKTNAACYQASNICIAKFNAGDPGGLAIPGGITIRTATASGSASQEDYVCWQGNTANHLLCGTSISNYSGCTRTVCTWGAADKICKYHGWRLPSENELANFKSYSTGKGSSGVQLCCSGAAQTKCDDNRCTYNGYCKGSATNNSLCQPHAVWSSSNTSGYTLTGPDWKRYNANKRQALSVRCVRD